MSIEVNSNTHDWVEKENITQLLKRMNYVFPMVVVKVNGVVVPKSRYGETDIPDNASIEVIHIESGG
ncbi:MAG: sulfur carrier protein ThiS [Thermoplasmata archaeon]